MTDELKQCPFCGSTRVSIMKLSDGKNKFAICMNCKASSNAAEKVEDVKYLWNKRAEPDRKKGTWEVQPSTGDDRPFIWWKCSECGHVIFSETERDRREFHAFCGRCGAEMTR